MKKLLMALTMFCAISFIHGQTERETYDNYVQGVKDRAPNKYTYSQFSVALRYRDSLQLNAGQIDALYDEVFELKRIKNQHYEEHGRSVDTRDIESEKMAQILSDYQYSLALRLKNNSKARSITDTNLKELELRDLLSGQNVENIRNQLYEYFVLRESLYDKYRHDLIRQSDETRILYYNRPQILKTLAKARRASQNNTLGKQLDGSIKSRDKEMNLNKGN